MHHSFSVVSSLEYFGLYCIVFLIHLSVCTMHRYYYREQSVDGYHSGRVRIAIKPPKTLDPYVIIFRPIICESICFFGLFCVSYTGPFFFFCTWVDSNFLTGDFPEGFDTLNMEECSVGTYISHFLTNNTIPSLLSMSLKDGLFFYP